MRSSVLSGTDAGCVPESANEIGATSSSPTLNLESPSLTHAQRRGSLAKPSRTLVRGHDVEEPKMAWQMNVGVAALGLLLLSGPDAMAGQGTIHRFEYAYFGERISLGVDPEMIALFRDPSRGEIDLLALVAGASAHPAAGAIELAPSSVPGWSYVRLPQPMQNELLVLDLVSRLEHDAALDFVSPVFVGDGGLPVIITPDLIVGHDGDGAGAAAAQALLALRAPGAEADRSFVASGMTRFRTLLRSAAEVLELALDMTTLPGVSFAQSDTIYWAQSDLIPNDPQFAQQWALSQGNDQDMDAPEAWDTTTGSNSVVVVVLDTGIQQNHPDIHQLPGQDFTGGGNGGGPNNACDNHGTCVGGCVAATINNAQGVVGVAPNCFVRSGKIFNEIQFFICLPFLESQDSWTVNGINWSVTIGARVTNSSWGGGTASAAITTAFNNTRAQGVIHFAAAGNDGTNAIGYPANIASQNAISALTSAGTLASFSTYGTGLFLSAPGAGILTTDRTGSDGYSSGNTTTIDGTSFASPYAAGVAALVISADPSLTPDGVEAIMAATAVDRGPVGYDIQYGHGFVNANNAVLAAMPPDCPEDIDGNDDVGFSDVLAILAAWGPCGGCDEDVDGSGDVGFSDVLAVLAAWGPC